MDTKQKYVMQIAYEGNSYSGWQRQANSEKTVQAYIEDAIEKIFGSKTSVIASGRLDAEVHARGLPVQFSLDTNLSEGQILRAINSHLPKDIRVILVEKKANSFHLPNHVTQKTYRYFLLHDAHRSMQSHWPFLRNWTWYYPYSLNFELLAKEMKCLEGEHDFAAFQNVGTPVESTVRTIYQAQLLQHSFDQNSCPWYPPPSLNIQLLELKFTGNGFLKQMVRNLVGTLTEIASNRAKVSSVNELFVLKDRKMAGATAPGYALFLNEVDY